MSEQLTEFQIAFVLIGAALSGVAAVWKSGMDGNDLGASVGLGFLFGFAGGLVAVITVAAPMAVVVCVVAAGVFTAVHKVAVRVKRGT